MVYFNSNMMAELRTISVNDLERLIQSLHTAFAEKATKITVTLQSFRGGEELCVSSYDFSEVYNGMGGR